VPFTDWCDENEQQVGEHELCLLTARAAQLNIGLDVAAIAVPTHYASEERIADLLDRLGKPASAKFIRDKLPEGPQIRSGDLGEILATEYVAEQTSFSVPIKRLRWKDHRNMAMRGDDLIGIRIPEEGPPLEFLKCEIKSRAALPTTTINEAREALDKNGGLPAPHALSFVADRLHETGNHDLADQIDNAQLRDEILSQQVCHLLFVFCGNNPKTLLNANLEGYDGAIPQTYVGLRIPAHKQFILDVYNKVIADGDDS
jgi:HamA